MFGFPAPVLVALCDDAIVIPTGKSGGRREAWVPLYDALREVLAFIPRRSTPVLTNGYGAPWIRDVFGSSCNKGEDRREARGRT